MSAQLPVTVNPERLARRGFSMSGSLKLADMPRLASSLVSSDGDLAEVTLEYSMQQRIPTVEGRVRTQLRLQCQRCMGEFLLPVDGEFHLGVVQTEAHAAALPTNLEPLFVTNDEVRLAELVEDELILLLPIVPLHADGTCKPKVEAAPVVTVSAKRENPFNALKKLKTPDSSN